MCWARPFSIRTIWRPNEKWPPRRSPGWPKYREERIGGDALRTRVRSPASPPVRWEAAAIFQAPAAILSVFDGRRLQVFHRDGTRALRDLANSQGPQDEARKCARDIQKDARRFAPVKTGTLRRGIQVEEITDLDTGIEGYAVGWNDKAFYGWLVEDGTEKEPAKPHLVPAAIRNGAISPGGER